MIKNTIAFLLCLSFLNIQAQDRKHIWVDSVFNTLSLEEKIGQLFFIKIPDQANAEQWKEIREMAKSGEISGVIQQHSSMMVHVNSITQLQKEAKVPVFVAMASTNGLGFSLDSALRFYDPVVLGATQSDSLVKAYGAELAFQMKCAGIQMNLGGSSSEFFNSDLNKNISSATYFLNALNEGGILASAQWTNDADSAISKTKEMTVSRLAAIQYSLKNKAKAETINLQTLRGKFSFQGLLMADARELQKFSPKKKKGDAERIGFTIGFDVIADPINRDAGVRQIKRLLKKDKQLMTRLDQSVRRILSLKYQSGLADFKAPSNAKLRLLSSSARWLKQTIAQQAVTVIKNEAAEIPVRKLDDPTFVSLAIGDANADPFRAYLNKYAAFSHLQLIDWKDTAAIASSLNRADVVVVSLYQNRISENELAFYLKKLAAKKRVILCSFEQPTSLKHFEELPTILAAYSDDDELQQAAAQVIFGGLPSKGTLPVTISGDLPSGTKINTQPGKIFSYQVPESAGMDSRVLEKIESIAKEAIDIGSTPGCYVQVVKDGKVIYDRGFGYLTYEKKSQVTDQTIYDLASVTKVTATLQTVMYMYEHGMIDPYKKASVYLPELRGTNKEDFTIKDILTHQAGLWPFLPFWAETVKDSILQKKYYGHQANEDYPFPVAENMFASKSMKDSLWQWIIKSKIRDKVPHTPYDYKYSDMGFYIMQHLAEKLLGMPIEDFLQKNLYQPIGASTMGYLPLRKFPMSQIAPTEDDKLFRKKLLVGYVHDQGAAMHGGIAGHAGLFSNANDLAKMGQLWLNGGSYGSLQFIKPETVNHFTQKQYETSRRGLGWDRPTISYWDGPTTYHTSSRTFGHTGFTGTCVWVDPEFNLVYVFLSNRVNPEMTNNKILNANIRPRIQEVIYQSIFEYCSRGGK
jgi:CubicO group peptidase (beta-lactamase class C family)